MTIILYLAISSRDKEGSGLFDIHWFPAKIFQRTIRLSPDVNLADKLESVRNGWHRFSISGADRIAIVTHRLKSRSVSHKSRGRMQSPCGDKGCRILSARYIDPLKIRW